MVLYSDNKYAICVLSGGEVKKNVWKKKGKCNRDYDCST